MVEKLASWLLGIFEDDPLPNEIRCLLFKVNKNNKFRFLQLLGYEKEINPNSLAFFPLEAHFFNCNKLSKMTDNEFFIHLKYIIDEAFANNELNSQVKNIKIYLQLDNKVVYLFTV